MFSFGFPESNSCTYYYCIQKKSFFEIKAGIDLSAFFVFTLSKDEIVIENGTFSNVYFYFVKKANGLSFYLSLKDIKKKDIDFEFIKSFVYSEDHSDIYKTPFHNVFNIVPGYKIVLKNQSAEIYHEEYQRKLPTNVGIKKLIEQNILKNINTDNLLATNVSGGLDSAAISAILKTETNLNVKYCVLSTSHNDSTEIEFRNDFEKKHIIKIKEVKSTIKQKEFLKLFSNQTHELCSRFGILSANAEIYKYLESEGIKQLIVGTGGDDIIGHGMSHIKELVSFDHLKLRAIIQLFSLKDVIEPFFYNWFSYSLKLKSQVTAAFLLINYRNRKSHFSLLKAFVSYFKFYRNPKGVLLVLSNIVLNKYYSLKLAVPKFYGEHNVIQNQESQTTYSYLFSNHNVGNNKLLTLTARLYNVLLTFPFINKNVLDWSQKYTIEEKFGEGYTRNHLREELRDILPPKIAERIHKTTWERFMIDKNKELVTETVAEGFHELLFTIIEKKWALNVLNTFLVTKTGSIKEKLYAKYAYRICIVNEWLYAVNGNV